MKRTREPSDIFDLLGCGVGFVLTIPLWMAIQAKMPHSDGPGPLLFYACAALPGLLVAFRVSTVLRERVPKGLAILFVVGGCFLAMAAKAILQPHPTPGHGGPGHRGQGQPAPGPLTPELPARPTPAPVTSREPTETPPQPVPFEPDPRARARAREIEEAARAAEDR